jgi:hypothetical protein
MFTGKTKTNPQKLQPEMYFPTLVSRHFDSAAEQGPGKFMLINPPDSVPVTLAAHMQAGFSRQKIDEYLIGEQSVQLHGMIEVFGEHDNIVTNDLSSRNRIGLPQTIVKYSAARLHGTHGADQGRGATDLLGHGCRAHGGCHGILAGRSCGLHLPDER